MLVVQSWAICWSASAWRDSPFLNRAERLSAVCMCGFNVRGDMMGLYIYQDLEFCHG